MKLKKCTRPYILTIIIINGVKFAIPFRSNISHPYAFLTDRPNCRGLDYSKAVVITNEQDQIDHSKQPYIRPDEFNTLRGMEHIIQNEMTRYLRTYKRALLDKQNPRNLNIIGCSTLQYFHVEIGL